LICDCGAKLGGDSPFPIHCHCGRVIGTATEVQKIRSCPVRKDRGIEHATICRGNPCGFYDAETDCCLKIVEIGLAQGRDKPGHISYLHGRPWVKCPVGVF